MRHLHARLYTWLRCLLAGLALAVISACTTPPPPTAQPARFAHDLHFGPPPEAVAATDTFAMSPAMVAYADEHLGAGAPRSARGRDPRQALLAALYQNKKLRLQYDDSHTRTAAQAFEQRAGNCLSLVLMTAAFAKHLDLSVTFQAVEVDETLERRGGLYLSSGHVNIVLQRPPLALRRGGAVDDDADLVVDFLPGRDVAGARVRHLNETTLVAMFNNNRAAEVLAAGQLAQGYWWARAAVLQAPGFMPAINTLGVVYDRAGLPDAAEQAYRQVLDKEPRNVAALSNLVGTLRRQGRQLEAEPVARLLARLQPLPPFQAFDEGRRAMAAQDYERAKRLFDQELEHQPHQAEVHHWAALANWHLGRQSAVTYHLVQARDYSGTRSDRDRYSAKLENLRSGVH